MLPVPKEEPYRFVRERKHKNKKISKMETRKQKEEKTPLEEGEERYECRR